MRLLIVFGIIFQWALRQVDFIMVYPQAEIEMDMYMEQPAGIHTKHGNSKDHVLKILANIYGQKKTGRVWNNCLVTKNSRNQLQAISCWQLCILQGQRNLHCLCQQWNLLRIIWRTAYWYHHKIAEPLLVYWRLQGHLADYLGLNTKRLQNNIGELSQRALIDSIIDDVALNNSMVNAVPAKVSNNLHAYLDKPSFSLKFSYRSVIGKFNYVAQTTRHDIVYAMHQLAKYLSNPREPPRGEAVHYLVRYLKKTCDLGTHFKPDCDKGFECYWATEFSWNKHLAPHDPSTAKSRSSWVVFYTRCPWPKRRAGVRTYWLRRRKKGVSRVDIDWWENYDD